MEKELEELKSKYKNYLDGKKEKYIEEDVNKILNTMEKLNIDKELLENDISVLGIKPSKFENIFNTFDELKLDRKILYYNPNIINETNNTRLKENVNLLKRNKINLEILKFFPEILATGKASDMAKVIKYINESDIIKIEPDFIIKNGDVLAYGKNTEIKKIVNCLKENNLLEDVIIKYPSVLYKNSADVVEDIIKLFKTSDILEEKVLKENLDLLAETTEVRITALINALMRLGINPNVINKNPKILYHERAKDVEDTIKELKNFGLENEVIENFEKYLGIRKPEKRKEILSHLAFLRDTSEIFKENIYIKPNLILSLDIDKICEFQEAVINGDIKEETLIKYPEIIKEKTVEDIKKVNEALHIIKEDKYKERFPQIYLISNPKNILEINKIFENENIDKKIYLNSPNIFLEFTPKTLMNEVSKAKNNKLDVNKEIAKLISEEKETEIKKEKKVNKTEDKKEEKVQAKTKIETNKEIKKQEETKEVKEEKEAKVVKEESKEKLNNSIDINMPTELRKKLEGIGINEEEFVEKLNINSNEMNLEYLQNIIEIFEYFEDIGISKELKNAYGVLNLNISKIKENMDILIENGLFAKIVSNLNVLKLEKEDLEKRINILKKKDKANTEDLLISQEEFLNKYDLKKEEFKKEKLLDYAQFNISNRFKKYLNIVPRQMYVDESKVYEKVYIDILELGKVNNNLEYIKCGEKFSILKIEENLYNILIGIREYEDVDLFDLSDFDKNEIIALTILGNRRLNKRKTEEIENSILKGEQEEEWEKENIVEIKPQKLEDKKQNIKVNLNIHTNKEMENTFEKEDIFKNMQEMYEANSLKLDKAKIMENELIVPEYEEALRQKEIFEKEEKLKQLESSIRSHLETLEQEDLKEVSGDKVLESIQNSIIENSKSSDGDLILLNNFAKKEEAEMILKPSVYTLENKDFELTKGITEELENTKDIKNENLSQGPMDFSSIKLNRLTVEGKGIEENQESINLENMDPNIDENLIKLEQEIMRELSMQNIPNGDVTLEDLTGDINSITINDSNKEEVKVKENLEENRQNEPNDEILSMLSAEREARAKLENEIESLKKMQEEFLMSLSKQEKEKQEHKLDAPNLNLKEEVKTEPVEIKLEQTDIEKDMQNGALLGYEDFQKIFTPTLDAEQLIREKFEETDKVDNIVKSFDQKEELEEDKNKEVLSMMENNLKDMKENLKMFEDESEIRRANFEARKRKKVQEILDRRARNKTIEEANKLEETARKLKEQAEALEAERLRLREEKETELERLRLEKEAKEQAEEEAKRRETERLKELENEFRRKEEERKKELEAIRLEQEEATRILKEEMERLELERKAKEDEEEKIAKLVKEEAQKIIQKQGLLDVKEEYEKLKKDLEIEKMYKQTETPKDLKLEETEELEESEEETTYPENISDFDKLTNNNQALNLNMFNEEENLNTVNEKDFFDLEDYGYLAQMVDTKEAERLKASMNMLFKEKRKDYTNEN